ncbi:hypothetical protein MRX96_041507 [Rhipicephalus microplus]|uniref:required for meiotic nuclear division 5 protein souji isoform X2 n=1 Tax=Rhipicephalus microplus TaxID=6941 RepID=UPI001888FBE7|nr:E3 ubiquitin-protein ligase RMND5A-like isoform X2 [Rhipicephalus microplus]XP_037282966.1 E3 ubiquitin-protein ligase RMND5A-like isoform X2 [Rhipicephalus microplus]
MESCLAVEREIDKVLSKFGTLNEHTQTTLSDLIAQGQEMYRELGEVPADADVTTSHGIALTQCAQKMKDLSSSLATEHRDLHGTVSKVGKAIDKNFVPDFWATSNEDVFDRSDKKKALNQVIVEHLLRQGMLDIAEELSREARLESAQKEPFAELNNVLDALKRRDLGPALDWVEQHELQGTALHFQLHRLHLVGLLQRAAAAEAIVYARAHLAPLARQHERDLQVLMGSLAFLRVPGGLSRSPYAFLLEPTLWSDTCEAFTRDACALLGLSVRSPLAVCVEAGSLALPALLNIKQVMMQRQVAGVWSSRDELPIEIRLSRQFHSVFACPILRQQSSDTNPPMRLVCGHVISRDALHKLASGSKLKCPYCPVEQNPSDARLIHF